MKSRLRLTAIVICYCLLINSISVSATTVDNKAEKPITMSDILDSEKRLLYSSDISIYYPDKSEITTKAVGDYPIYTQVKKYQSSSSGLKSCSSKIGTYASIASFALSFISGIPAMRVRQIFSVVSLAVSDDQYAQAKTFYSYVNYTKEGQAKWSTDSGYSTMVFSGKREYYKHVLAGTQNSQGQWTTKSSDYLDEPAKVEKGTYYDNSDSWFKEQARQRLLTGLTLDDLPW